MKTTIATFFSVRQAFIGAAAAILIAASLPMAALAAGEHKGGHESMPMKGGSGHGQGSHGHDLNVGMPGKAADISRTIDVVMQDNFFNHKSISVKAGETIRFKIKNTGTLLHEFGLGTAAMHANHQKQMVTMMEHGMIEAERINPERMKMDHGGMNMMSHNDPSSVLVEPGKTGEVIWKFTNPMKLEFACNVPGHYESGMMGAIEFKK